MPGGDAHTLGSGTGARAGRVPGPAKGRKEGSTPPDLTFFVAKSRLLRTLPHSASVPLSPSPKSWAETLILRREFLPWPQHTGHATCNLQIMVIRIRSSFQRTAPCCEGGDRADGEAGEVETLGPRPAS